MWYVIMIVHYSRLDEKTARLLLHLFAMCSLVQRRGTYRMYRAGNGYHGLDHNQWDLVASPMAQSHSPKDIGILAQVLLEICCQIQPKHCSTAMRGDQKQYPWDPIHARDSRDRPKIIRAEVVHHVSHHLTSMMCHDALMLFNCCSMSCPLLIASFLRLRASRLYTELTKQGTQKILRKSETLLHDVTAGIQSLRTWFYGLCSNLCTGILRAMAVCEGGRPWQHHATWILGCTSAMYAVAKPYCPILSRCSDKITIIQNLEHLMPRRARVYIMSQSYPIALFLSFGRHSVMEEAGTEMLWLTHFDQ